MIACIVMRSGITESQQGVRGMLRLCVGLCCLATGILHYLRTAFLDLHEKEAMQTPVMLHVLDFDSRDISEPGCSEFRRI